MEEILDSCLRHNKLEFLVKWEGYMNENNSWEPEDNCRNVHNIMGFTSCYGKVFRAHYNIQYSNLVFLPVHQFKPRTEPLRTSSFLLFSSRFGSGKFVKVRFTVQQKVLRTGLN